MTRQQMTRDQSVPKQRLLNLDLSRLAFPLMLLVIAVAPYPRALFFQSDLLPFHIFCAGILALILFDEIIARSPVRWEPETLAAAALPVCYLLSFTVSVDKQSAITEFLKYLNYFAVFYVIRRCVRNPGTLRNMMRALVASAVVISFIGLGSALKIVDFPGASTAGSIASTFQYRNALGGFLLAGFVNALVLMSSGSGPIESLPLSAASFVLGLTIITTYSRGTWSLLPIVVAALVAILPQTSRWKALYATVTSLTCSFLVLRKFWEAVAANQARTGLTWLAVGSLAAVLLEAVWHIGARIVSNQGGLDRKYKTLVLTIAVIYVLTLGGIYGMYALDAYPNLVARVLPKQVINRAEDIKADESSLIGRLDFMGDALKIAARSPLIGSGGGAWNALYHMYQDRLYWTTETHSHYFQMLTEVGIIGVASLVAMWVFIIARISRSVDPDNDPDEWAVVIGAFAAVGALSLHAAIDFDLSMPANAYIVWAMLAGIAGATSHWLGHRDVRRVPPKAIASLHTPLVRAVALALAVCVLSVLPYRLYRAGQLGAEGARWLSANNLAKAERSYLAALSHNPWNAGFYFDAAQAKIGSYFVLHDDRLVQKADEYITRALRVQPYNLPVRARLVDLYIVQGRFEEAVKAAEEVARIVPMDSTTHEGLARASVLTALHFVDISRPDKVRDYTAKVLEVEQRVMQLASQDVDASFGKRPTVTPKMVLCVGQAQLLENNLDAAIQSLTKARGDKELRDDADVWLGLALVKAGQATHGEDVLEAVIKRKPTSKSEVARLSGLLGVKDLEVLR